MTSHVRSFIYQCVLRFRNEILQLQQTHEHEQVSKTSILDEHKKTLQSLRKETVSQLANLLDFYTLNKKFFLVYRNRLFLLSFFLYVL